jgi:hypothetical protein
LRTMPCPILSIPTRLVLLEDLVLCLLT